MKRSRIKPFFVFKVKKVFGKYYYYPLNRHARELLTAFAGRSNRKAFKWEHMLWFRRCGAQIEIRKEEDKENEWLSASTNEEDNGLTESDGGGDGSEYEQAICENLE